MRTLSIFLTAAVLLTPAAIALDLEGAIDEPISTNLAERWIVGFYGTPPAGDTYQGERVLAVDTDLDYLLVETLHSDLFKERASLDENVRYIESDLNDYQLFFTPNDYFWTHSSNYGVIKIGAQTAWDVTLGSTSIKNGHIDSGIFRTHEDFTPSSRFLTGWNYYSGNNNPADNSGCSWHGTHTTGTVAATINNAKGFPGLAQITVIPVKIFGGGACFATTTTNIANALKFVGDQGAHLSSNSWGGGAASSTINSAITYSVNKGVIFVAASGNGACSNCVSQPWIANEANVIIVTATDVNDAAYTSNSKGPQTDISAPGVGIGSAGGPNVNSYYVMTGTSMATPHVTGVAALIKTLNPTFTRADVESRLKSTAVDLGPAGEDDTFGAGRLNAAAAVF